MGIVAFMVMKQIKIKILFEIYTFVTNIEMPVKIVRPGTSCVVYLVF